MGRNILIGSTAADAEAFEALRSGEEQPAAGDPMLEELTRYSLEIFNWQMMFSLPVRLDF